MLGKDGRVFLFTLSFPARVANLSQSASDVLGFKTGISRSSEYLSPGKTGMLGHSTIS